MSASWTARAKVGGQTLAITDVVQVSSLSHAQHTQYSRSIATIAPYNRHLSQARCL